MNFPTYTVKFKSAQYPELLKHIPDPPKQLYCRGNLDLLQTECFAVVGTRSLTAYGKEAAQTIVPGLAKHFTIVSGLALGIDAVAHRATLDAGGRTIAVLGSGVELITPDTNRKLGQDILKNGGLIVSEEEGKKPAHKGSFPIRNRIISGLSKGTLIIEADEKSGSLITAKLTGEQNRDVFAVPGSIFSTKSFGPHKLIRMGAKLVTSAHDVLEEYSLLPLDRKQALSTQNPEHEAILAILESHGPSHIDVIIADTGRNAAEVMADLSLMELQGLVKQMSGGVFRRND